MNECAMAKYDPLKHHLDGQAKAEIIMEFKDIEKVISGKLPPSAHTHRAWWANEWVGSHVHCRSWLDAGYSLDQVDFARERIVF